MAPQALIIGPMNFPRLVRGGGDYIERNAMTLIEVINYVNGKMVDPVHDHITIVGPSMGGQISRYALRWMEKHNMVHNCNLWVSMDSPHEGAVLPIGLQSFVKEMSGYSKKSKEMLTNQINVPAARQQLIHHHLANSETPQGSPGFFNRYYDLVNGVGWDADGKGWPQLPRRVALNSGAHNGLQQQGSSCSPAVWLKIRPRNWVRVLFTTTIGTRVESTIKFSPSSSNGRCQVLDLKLKTLVGDVSRPSYATHSGTYSKSLELLPGGWYPGFQELYDNLSAGGWGWAVKLEKEMYVANHTHIPTASALAYGKGPNPNPNRKWDDDIRYVNIGLTCGTGEIPFHSYQGPLDFNTKHDALFETQAQFLINEITGNIATIPGLVISGPTNACNNISSSYSVNLPAGASVVWSAFPSGIVTLSPGNSYAVEATPINNPTGSYTLTATVTSSCITTPVNTQVNFYSTPPPPYDCYEIGNGTCSQTQYLCTEQFFTEKGFMIPNNIPGVPYWHWVVYGGTFSDGSTDKIVPRSTNMMTVTPQYGYMSYVIYITPVSECMVERYSPFSYVVLNTNQPWPCDGYYFVMSPNPASSDITVSTIESNSKTRTDRSITAINIYNQQGMLRKQKQFGKVKKASLSISDLANGVYVVEIISGDYKERKQLLVKH